jgi:hypothetical protein
MSRPMTFDDRLRLEQYAQDCLVRVQDATNA